jgi:hypothetical protein
MSRGNQILNYTTTVEAGRTVGEIIGLLAAKKAVSINTDYQEGKATAITFVIRVGENLVPFRLAPQIQGVAQKLPNKRDIVRAERVAWRILLRWVEAQLAMVESLQAEMGQVFLPYAVDNEGETFWKAFQASNTKRLTGGKSE